MLEQRFAGERRILFGGSGAHALAAAGGGNQGKVTRSDRRRDGHGMEAIL
jgi:hypothetical protein